MSAISDIDICYSDIGDKYVKLKNVIPISEVFRYRHPSSFRYPILKNKIFAAADLNPCPLEWLASAITLSFCVCLCRVICRISDIGLKFIPISDIMSDSALSVRYRKFRYQAQSDIADHGHRTKCPPMPKATGKCLGNSLRYEKAAGKCLNTHCQPIGEKAELPSGY
jgi:hypothetical protein